MKTSVILALFAAALGVLADVPPACLLNAVNTQDNPSDLSAICGKEATDVQKAIASICGSNQSVAQSAFIATCSGAGSSVAPYTATSTSSKGPTTGASSTGGSYVYTTAVYNSDCQCTTTIVTSATGGAVASVTGSASATSSAATTSSTGNAAADVKQVGSFAAAAIAMAAVVAVL
ncbi:hypothetical protein A1O3_10017 [Capronia epimyces CBS 606.96]|uniref:Extracellular membrane protein CFEM domain-containing protein n=1 Tax=Capronia epimyces CBS 606.96 TaxID=1182542 RepID=W9XC24_9EURO|nr:uncharacterized protein A1O3_10017 [Capronia epimyces CBS 606.96]EXJ77788.1 hypothetical protein A1O3_10017 [Capronia epimyces CBS 606.96]